MDYIVLSSFIRIDIRASLYRRERSLSFQSYQCETSPTYTLTKINNVNIKKDYGSLAVGRRTGKALCGSAADCWAVHSDLQQWVSGNGSTNSGRGSVRAASAVCWVIGNVSAVPGSLVGWRREGSSGSLPWAVQRICKFSGERRDRSACLELWWCWVVRWISDESE